MSNGRRRARQLVAEATLSGLDPSAVEVLRKLVDQFDGKAELAYRSGEWSFSVRYVRGEEVPFETPKLPAEDRSAPHPVSSAGSLEDEEVKERSHGWTDGELELRRVSALPLGARFPTSTR